MSITVEVLGIDDKVRDSDWCRPLTMHTLDYGDAVPSSAMGGTPSNNMKWVQVQDVLGEYWFGRTVGSITKAVGQMEFVRGEIPLTHRLDMKDYVSLKIFKKP